ncbi:hypothetical protein QQX98_011247 [Neonectria punicea]|uniref:Uncharacterized protein n=1 Tax=Neonectria punicea TaxID=979145 RepID=A0ABR1GMA3_9HYPO
MADQNSPGQAAVNQTGCFPRQVRDMESQTGYDSDEAEAFLAASLSAPPCGVRQNFRVVSDEDEISELDLARPRNPERDEPPLYGSDDELADEDEEWVSDLVPRNEGLFRTPWEPNQQRDLPSAANGAPDKAAEEACTFDDREMVVVQDTAADDEASESEFEVDTVSTFVIPMGLRVQVTYTEEQLHPHATRAKALARSIPGARRLETAVASGASALQTTCTRVAGRVGTAARAGSELVVLGGGQARRYLADEAWHAGVDMAVRFQENWPAMMQPLRDGWAAYVEDFVRVLPQRDRLLGARRRRHL